MQSVCCLLFMFRLAVITRKYMQQTRADHGSAMDKSFNECVIIEPIFLTVSCRQVLAMVDEIWRHRQRRVILMLKFRVEHDQSCEKNAHYIRIYLTNEFASPIWCIYCFYQMFFNVIFQHEHKKKNMKGDTSTVLTIGWHISVHFASFKYGN